MPLLLYQPLDQVLWGVCVCGCFEGPVISQPSGKKEKLHQRLFAQLLREKEEELTAESCLQSQAREELPGPASTLCLPYMPTSPFQGQSAPPLTSSEPPPKILGYSKPAFHDAVALSKVCLPSESSRDQVAQTFMGRSTWREMLAGATQCPPRAALLHLGDVQGGEAKCLLRSEYSIAPLQYRQDSLALRTCSEGRPHPCGCRGQQQVPLHKPVPTHRAKQPAIAALSPSLPQGVPGAGAETLSRGICSDAEGRWGQKPHNTAPQKQTP